MVGLRDPDGELVGRAQAELPHGTHSFSELVRRYSKTVYQRAHRVVGSAPDAEEIVQEVFTRVFRALPDYRFEKPFVHWLNSITINCCRNLLRSRTRDRRRRRALAAEPNAASDESDVLLQWRLGAALDALDPTTRIAIVLRHVEQRSFGEIAEMLELGESAVKMRVMRGLQRLRSDLSRGSRQEGAD